MRRQGAQPAALMAAATGVRARRQRARKGEWRGEWVIEELEHSVYGAGVRQGDRTRGSGAWQWHGASFAWLPRAPPLGNFPEHLAGDDMATLEPNVSALIAVK